MYYQLRLGGAGQAGCWLLAAGCEAAKRRGLKTAPWRTQSNGSSAGGCWVFAFEEVRRICLMLAVWAV